jgi:hypothetical protein
MARRRGSVGGETSLHAAMVAPSASPDVVVLDFVDEDSKFQEVSDPKKDLWLTTVDGQVIYVSAQQDILFCFKFPIDGLLFLHTAILSLASVIPFHTPLSRSCLRVWDR